MVRLSDRGTFAFFTDKSKEERELLIRTYEKTHDANLTVYVLYM